MRVLKRLVLAGLLASALASVGCSGSGSTKPVTTALPAASGASRAPEPPKLPEGPPK